jgi:DNA repair exonuclease SbcCD ATPase subunit
MANSTPPPSKLSPSPSSNIASWRLRWAQRLSWLISALSGTLEIEAETERLRQENVKLDGIILQTKNETEQIENEIRQIENDIERLAELESKIEALFSKHGINLPLAQKPEQP